MEMNSNCKNKLNLVHFFMATLSEDVSSPKTKLVPFILGQNIPSSGYPPKDALASSGTTANELSQKSVNSLMCSAPWGLAPHSTLLTLTANGLL